MKLFSTYFRKKDAQIEKFIKMHPVRARLFHADGQTDMTKLLVVFERLQTRLQVLNIADYLPKTQFYFITINEYALQYTSCLISICRTGPQTFLLSPFY
jgi:hypothetical protein